MEDIEIWKNIKGYERLYMISSKGRVKSLKRISNNTDGRVRVIKERILKQSESTYGYLLCCLRKNNLNKTIKTHKLVADNFLHHKSKQGFVIDHIDNDKTNNNANNLQIITIRENVSKDSKRKYSKYIGVTYELGINKWRARISVNGKVEHLGVFDIEENARDAYMNELKKIK